MLMFIITSRVGANTRGGAGRADATARAGGGGRAGTRAPGGVRRVEHVDVDGQVQRRAADPLADPGDYAVDADALDLHRVHDAEPKLGVLVQVTLGVQGPA